MNHLAIMRASFSTFPTSHGTGESIQDELKKDDFYTAT